MKIVAIQKDAQSSIAAIAEIGKIIRDNITDMFTLGGPHRTPTHPIPIRIGTWNMKLPWLPNVILHILHIKFFVLIIKNL